MEKPTKKHYSFEVKKEVVDRFLAGETRMDLAKECKLSSPQQVKDWVSTWHKKAVMRRLGPHRRDDRKAQLGLYC
ncbi:hypothetical protein CIP107521_00161 [Corynebacterium diphtheriae]|nr:hypothetical protein CIP107521_00161 [Corynebacterium diphtheriae]